VKLNVDGSFVAESGSGGAGMVLRDDKGEIIFSSYRFLPRSSISLEAEIVTCMEGYVKIIQFSPLPCIIELDCLEAVNLIKNISEERSAITFMLKEIKEFLNALGASKTWLAMLSPR
jgi:hypothetical protein